MSRLVLGERVSQPRPLTLQRAIGEPSFMLTERGA